MSKGGRRLQSVLRNHLDISVDEVTAEGLLRMAKKRSSGGYVQWMTSDGVLFRPASDTTAKLSPGFYRIGADMSGMYFARMAISTEGLIRLPDTNSDKVIEEIQSFWEKENLFRENKLTYKRGILLHGPPGSGKTATARIVTEDVIGRGGIVIQFFDPDGFASALRVLREIQPDIPVVVLMEDLDTILYRFVESSVINLLDGVGMIDKVVFLATTNYPEKMGERVVNRPSRFDRRFYIGPPNEEARRLYLTHLFSQGVEDPQQMALAKLDQWVKDTEGMSIAHLKELFVAVEILETPYDEAIRILKGMSALPSSEQYKGEPDEIVDSGPAYNEVEDYGEKEALDG
jgi:hypothetical protein